MDAYKNHIDPSGNYSWACRSLSLPSSVLSGKIQNPGFKDAGRSRQYRGSDQNKLVVRGRQLQLFHKQNTKSSQSPIIWYSGPHTCKKMEDARKKKEKQKRKAPELFLKKTSRRRKGKSKTASAKSRQPSRVRKQPGGNPRKKKQRIQKKERIKDCFFWKN